MKPLALDAERSLRPVDGGDIEELHALVRANRDHLAPWMPWAGEAVRENTETFLRTAQEQAADGNGVQFAIIERGADRRHHRLPLRQPRAALDEHRLLARCQLRRAAARSRSPYGKLVDHAFHVWRLHRVEIRVAVGNARSRAIPQRLGFTEEGVVRDGERFGARYVDLVMYSMLEPEWRSRRERN